MLYTRLDDEGRAFEPQRNVIHTAYGLDGGGSVAADNAGNVYVAWHAPRGGEGEQNRGVWLTRSRDEGRTFDEDRFVSDAETGACGCCGMRAFAGGDGTLYLVYRGARRQVERGMYLLESHDRGGKFTSRLLEPWLHNGCPMSSSHVGEQAGRAAVAWETGENVRWAKLDERAKPQPRTPAGEAKQRKHPVLAVDRHGRTLLAWTEGMSWSKPGALAWQVFDAEGKPTDRRGRTEGVPTWSLVAAVAKPDGGFVIIY
jgi:hypothetical protein